MPVFLVYHLGLLLTDLRNGADFVTAIALSVLDRSVIGYVVATVAFAAVVVFWGMRLSRGYHLEPKSIVPLLVESAAWTLVLLVVVGSLTGFFMGSWAMIEGPLLQLGPRTLGPIERVVMAAGAGFHEELAFRVVLFGGGALALERWRKLSPLHAGLIAAVASSLVFSAVHYVGSLGDAFTFGSFLFRYFMGLAFVALYRFRGFAVAVYTHALYDLLVFFVIGDR